MPYYGLPNILARDFVVPELIQDDATAVNLAQAVVNLLGDAPVRARLAHTFAAMSASLSRGAARQAALAVLPLLRTDMICGVDEAGRGPLAGPVYAAAVILGTAHGIVGLADSKTLGARRREVLAVNIKQYALAWAVASASVEEIDTLNILQATLLAMRRAVESLATMPTEVLVDGLYCPRDCAAGARHRARRFRDRRNIRCFDTCQDRARRRDA